MELSIIIPVYNEEENLRELGRELLAALPALKPGTEVIFVNDGSSDGSLAGLRNLVAGNYNFKIVSFARNFGQSAALAAGIDYSSGEIIVAMDADLQNDPADIPALLAKLGEGYDVVSGWRRERRDNTLSRKIPSRIANLLISLITGIHLHDYGCTLKAYRAKIIKNVRLYGEMHRFIPAYASWYGARVAEIPVRHRPRKFGKTKYGISRTLRVLLDLLVIKFLSKYLARPIHFFGGFGLALLFASGAAGLLALYLKIFQAVSFISTPLPLLTVFLAVIGIQFALLGLLAEILIRVYFENGNRKNYLVGETVHFE
ncbi:glycosyltransferase [Patescibacteria group bacterium]|nr:MAG: glycosyltransferase [Patescibacteria group bacterium]